MKNLIFLKKTANVFKEKSNDFFFFPGKIHDFFMYSISLQKGSKIPQTSSGKCIGTPNNRKKGGHHHPSINGKLQKSIPTKPHMA